MGLAIQALCSARLPHGERLVERDRDRLQRLAGLLNAFLDGVFLFNVARVTDATVAMVNAGYAFDLAERYAISSVPTLLLFEDGDLVGRLADGFQGADAVVSFVESSRRD